MSDTPVTHAVMWGQAEHFAEASSLLVMVLLRFGFRRTVFHGCYGPDLLLGNWTILIVFLTAMLSHLLSFLFLDPPPLSHLPLSFAVCIFWNHFISVYFLLISLILPNTPLSPTCRMFTANKGSQLHPGHWEALTTLGKLREWENGGLSPLEPLLLERSFSLFLSKNL